jgi:hypothetical protein
VSNRPGNSRRDLYRIAKELATRAGATTVIRGPFQPKDKGDFRDDQYPVAAFVDTPDGETCVSDDAGGFRYSGVFELWLWATTGDLSSELGETPGYSELDDLHDALLDHLSDSYPELHGQTVSFFTPDDGKPWWLPYWWYVDVDPEHVGAGARIGYNFNYGTKDH